MSVADTAAVSLAQRRSSWIPSRAVEDTGPEPPAGQLPGLDDTEQSCWQSFLEASSLLLEALNRRLMETHKLSLFDFLVLDMLATSPNGSARMGDLAQALVLGPSRVTQQIRRLESEGLVRRARSTSDRRGVVASVTREGVARLRPAARTYADAIRTYYLDQMSRQQMIALGDSCRRINHPLEVADGS